MPAAIENLCVALFALRNVADRKKALATAVASAYTPGLLGLALPLFVARSDRSTTTTADPGTLVAVPDVIGKPEAEAKATVTKSQLNPVSESFFNASVASGSVIDQVPRAGVASDFFVESGSDVVLKVSLGPTPDAPPSDDEIDLQIQKDVAAAKAEIEGKIEAATTKVLEAIGSAQMPKPSAPIDKSRS